MLIDILTYQDDGHTDISSSFFDTKGNLLEFLIVVEHYGLNQALKWN